MKQIYLRQWVRLVLLFMVLLAVPAIGKAQETPDATPGQPENELYIEISKDGSDLVSVARMTLNSDGYFSFPFKFKHEYGSSIKFRFYNTNQNIESNEATTYTASQKDLILNQNKWKPLTSYANQNETEKDYTLNMTSVPVDGVNLVFIVSPERDEVMVKRATRYVTGMPFYPNDYPSEPAFQNIKEDEKFFYLVGNGLNNGIPSPEWELRKKDGVYELDFTYFKQEGSNNVSVFAFTKNDSEPKVVLENVSIPSPKEGFEKAGVRMRATYTPGGNLKFEYLKADGSTTTEVNEAQHLPAISFFAERKVEENDPGWSQQKFVPNANEIPVGNGDVVVPGALPQAWIQYKNGKAVEARDGNVLCSTQWPPKGEVMLYKSFTPTTIEWGQTYTRYFDFGMNSEALTFKPTEESKTAEAWKEDSRFSAVDISTASKEAKYMLYEATDVWLFGDVKLWTGWNGDLDPNDPDDKRIFGDEMTFDKPTYYPKVYLFINENNPNDIFPYYQEADASILAVSHTDYSHGEFLPRILNYPVDEEGNGRVVSNIIINLYTMANPNTDHYIRPIQVKTTTFPTWYAKSNLWHTHNQEDFIYPDITVNNAENFNKLFGELLQEKDSDEKYDYGQFYSPRTDADSGAKWYTDTWNYYMSGWYFYTMEVTFDEGEENELRLNAKSNPFYIQLPETPLNAYQLIDAKDYNGGEYSYITYETVKEKVWVSDWERKEYDKVYGVKTDGSDNVTEVKKIDIPAKEFYEENNWTDLLLLANEVPLELLPQMTEKATWGYMGEIMPTDEYPGNEPFYKIVRAGALNDNEYNVDYYYKSPTEMYVDYNGINLPEEPVEQTDFRDSYSTIESLMIPTPRMHETLTLEVNDVENYGNNLVADSYRGATRALNEYDDNDSHEYKNARLRTLTVTLPLERPNATDELLSYVTDKRYDVAIKDSYDRINNDNSGYENTEDNDKEFMGNELSFLNNYDVKFVDQNITKWIQNTNLTSLGTDAYEAKVHSMEVKFVTPTEGVNFYKRYQKPLEVKVADPMFTAPNLNGADNNNSWSKQQLKAIVYYVYENDDKGEFALAEYIYLTAFPALGEDAYQGKGQIGNCVFDINNPGNPDDNGTVPHYAFGVKNSNADANAPALVGLDGIKGFEDEKSTPSLISQKFLTDPTRSMDNSILVSKRFIELKEGEMFNGNFYNGMPALELGIGQAYFFNVDDRVEFVPKSNGASEETAVKAKAPRKEPELEPSAITVAFVPVLDTYALESQAVLPDVTKDDGGIMTGVNNVTGNRFSIFAGKGFIDLNGNEADVYTGDGRHVYAGSGRTYVPQGVYLVRLDGATVKVLVK